MQVNEVTTDYFEGTFQLKLAVPSLSKIIHTLAQFSRTYSAIYKIRMKPNIQSFQKLVCFTLLNVPIKVSNGVQHML